VYQRILSASEVSALYAGGRSGGTPASSSQLTTSWTLDQRGLPTSMTDPDGNVTGYAYDELRDLSKPVIRADMALVAGYQHVSRPPLKLPITLLIGERDEWLASGDAHGWADYTSEDFDVRVLLAGHWFMEEDPAVRHDALRRFPVRVTGRRLGTRRSARQEPAPCP
jgi:surfactin synthase thioesterase subunit